MNDGFTTAKYFIDKLPDQSFNEAPRQAGALPENIRQEIELSHRNKCTSLLHCAFNTACMWYCGGFRLMTQKAKTL